MVDPRYQLGTRWLENRVSEFEKRRGPAWRVVGSSRFVVDTPACAPGARRVAPLTLISPGRPLRAWMACGVKSVKYSRLLIDGDGQIDVDWVVALPARRGRAEGGRWCPAVMG